MIKVWGLPEDDKGRSRPSTATTASSWAGSRTELLASSSRRKLVRVLRSVQYYYKRHMPYKARVAFYKMYSLLDKIFRPYVDFIRTQLYISGRTSKTILACRRTTGSPVLLRDHRRRRNGSGRRPCSLGRAFWQCEGVINGRRRHAAIVERDGPPAGRIIGRGGRVARLGRNAREPLGGAAGRCCRFGGAAGCLAVRLYCSCLGSVERGTLLASCNTLAQIAVRRHKRQPLCASPTDLYDLVTRVALKSLTCKSTATCKPLAPATYKSRQPLNH